MLRSLGLVTHKPVLIKNRYWYTGTMIEKSENRWQLIGWWWGMDRIKSSKETMKSIQREMRGNSVQKTENTSLKFYVILF